LLLKNLAVSEVPLQVDSNPGAEPSIISTIFEAARQQVSGFGRKDLLSSGQDTDGLQCFDRALRPSVKAANGLHLVTPELDPTGRDITAGEDVENPPSDRKASRLYAAICGEIPTLSKASNESVAVHIFTAPQRLTEGLVVERQENPLPKRLHRGNTDTRELGTDGGECCQTAPRDSRRGRVATIGSHIPGR